jgi:TPP-dependent pyruvate/acetoin dehydrogenase alpha subunit
MEEDLPVIRLQSEKEFESALAYRKQHGITPEFRDGAISRRCMRYNKFLRTWKHMPNKNKKKPATRKSGAKKRPDKTSMPAARNTAASNVQAADTPASVLDSKKLQGLYSSMLQCRMLSGKLQELSASENFSPANGAVSGYEAVLVGAAAHALPQDLIIAARNDALAQFMQGAPVEKLLAQRVSTDRGPAMGMANTSPAQRSLAHGMRLAQEMKGAGKAVLVFCGEDAAAAASRQEALALAARQKLPLVCLIEFDLPALVEAQSLRAAAAAGEQNMESFFPQIPVDGTDVVAVFRVAQEAVRRARGGHGPSLIQCVMPEKARAMQGKSDPLAFMERYLRRRKLWSNEWRKKLMDDFQRRLGTA